MGTDVADGVKFVLDVSLYWERFFALHHFSVLLLIISSGLNNYTFYLSLRNFFVCSSLSLKCGCSAGGR
jgi:hypothetical protein